MIRTDLHQDLVSYLRENDINSQTSVKGVYNNLDFLFGSIFIEPSPASIAAQQKQIEKDIIWYKKSPFKTIKNKRDLFSSQKGVIIHLEGAYAIDEIDYLLDKWYELGLRSLGPLWNVDNSFGRSAASNSKAGLTKLGKKLIRKCNDLGIIVDCSHINKAGFYDILDISKRPPIVTHGNAYKICPNSRNFTDRQIKELAKAEGIIGVFFSAKFVNQKDPATIDDVINHIEHIIDIAGIEAVAIGSDLGGISSGFVKGLSRVDELPNLKTELKKRGFKDKDIKKIFGLNALGYLQSALR